MPHRVLGIIDRTYRGAVESQFFDPLYGFLDMREQLGAVDIVLRGLAVTLAVQEQEYSTELDLGAVRLDTLPDYRGVVRDLVGAGMTVTADEPDLRGLGFTGADLLPGVACADTNQLARTWPRYDKVWFV
ncbi:hypothetical protein [Amycolatopsis aidingensis]|uniref:hypothetical protein n=1 Tax=Amycolatopsis aidingensis TaxID=2842453 RepID=UPI001C0C94F0|nr:hypothetical protein [Amycolatopsis aidingensis]